MKRIYLDNAATSWPKPDTVFDAIDAYQRRSGAPAGRGAYQEAIDVQRTIEQTRLAIAQLISVDTPQQIIFAYSGTDALHLALGNWLQTGDHVITTVCDHNSTLRPLNHLEKTKGIALTHVGVNAHGIISIDDFESSIRENTRLVAMVHASNVTGAIQPLEAVGQICHQRGIPFLVDAAQTVGHCDVNVKELHCDLLAAPGHKGMLGPLGTAFLYLSKSMSDRLTPVRMGGTGSQSERDEQPDRMPDKFESGNLNTPGIVGLKQGLEFIRQRGIAAISKHEQQLMQRLRNGLQTLPGVQLYGAEITRSVGVTSLNIDGHDPQELATLLDTAASIQTRAGFHCAPRMHHALKTDQRGGTLRISCGPFTTESDIDKTLETIEQLISS
ncbi:MAG: aminotransferase class V-fold PLP-dependent enzyme [Planctomycetaceae bacterium]|nr:aminotransferase class V-fold PLP-dependent enzyme [Planctomycetaceae bacterium]